MDTGSDTNIVSINSTKDVDDKSIGGTSKGKSHKLSNALSKEINYGLSKSDIELLLGDYILIPKNNICDLNKGIHIRYMHKTLGFRYGGYFLNFIKDDEGNILKIMLENYQGGNRSQTGYKFYTVLLSNIRAIYKKIAPYSNYELGILQRQMAKSEKKISDLESTVKSLKKRISKLENK